MPDTSDKEYGYKTLIGIGAALMAGGPAADGALLAKLVTTSTLNAGDFIAVFGIGAFLLAAGLFLRTYSRAQSYITQSHRDAAGSIAQIATEFARRATGIDVAGSKNV